MNALDYLSRAYKLDQQINSKLEHLQRLNELALKATATFTGMPHSPNRGKATMADTVDKIIDLQREINEDIDRFIDTKREIMGVINELENPVYRTLLELRFINGKSWEQIADEMEYSIQHTYRMRDRALKKIISDNSYR